MTATNGPAEGYDEIAVEYVEAAGYTEVRAISADLIPSVAFASSTGEGSESFSQVNIPVSLSGSVGMTVTVDYAVTGGTATGGGNNGGGNDGGGNDA